MLREADPASIAGRLCRSIEAIPFVVLDALLYFIYFIALSFLAIIGFVTRVVSFVKQYRSTPYPKD